MSIVNMTYYNTKYMSNQPIHLTRSLGYDHLISSHNFKQSPLTSSQAVWILTQSTGSLTGQSHLVSSQGMQSDLPVPMRKAEEAWLLNMLNSLHKAAVTHPYQSCKEGSSMESYFHQ